MQQAASEQEVLNQRAKAAAEKLGVVLVSSAINCPMGFPLTATPLVVCTDRRCSCCGALPAPGEAIAICDVCVDCQDVCLCLPCSREPKQHGPITGKLAEL